MIDPMCSVLHTTPTNDPDSNLWLGLRGTRFGTAEESEWIKAMSQMGFPTLVNNLEILITNPCPVCV